MQQQAQRTRRLNRTDHYIESVVNVPSTNTGNGSKDRRWPAGLGHRWGRGCFDPPEPQERHPLVKDLELVRVAVRDLNRSRPVDLDEKPF